MDTIKGWLHSTNAKADEATQKHRDAGEVPTNAAEVDSEPASEELGTTDAWAPHGRELRESAGSLTGQRNHPWQSGDSTSGQEKRRRASIASCRMLARCRFSARKREQSTRSPSVTNVPGKCWCESLVRWIFGVGVWTDASVVVSMLLSITIQAA